MNQAQEIRAKALEIAVQIIGKASVEDEATGELLINYLPLADLVGHYIQWGQEPAVLPVT